MENTLTDQTKSFYRNSLLLLKESEIPFMLGGAFALNVYTGVYRFTKDLDIFCKKVDYKKILSLFKNNGYVTDDLDPLWIAKIFQESDYIDIIFNSGNSLCPVDDEWFRRKTKAKIFNVEVDVIPVEEMIWQKLFIQNRDRFDGADIYHLILKRGKKLDWNHIYNRMKNHFEILLSHLINFCYIYPSEKDIIPKWLLDKLLERFNKERFIKCDKICRGPLLALGEEYKIDIEEWGFKNPMS